MQIEPGARPTTATDSLWRRGLWYAFQVFLALRIGTLVWVLILSVAGGRAIVEPDVLCKSESVVEGHLDPDGLPGAWLRWDTICYLILAESGYEAQPGLTVWPPLYPLAIRLLSGVVDPPLLAALVISSLATWLAFFLLYLLVAESQGEVTARNTLVLYAVYPSAFFLVAGYTESLFLALAAGSLLLARKRHWLLAGVAAALATLTRNQGIVLSLVLLWEGMLRYREERGLRAGEPGRLLIAAALPALTFAGFALYVRYGIGAAWPWQTLATVWGQYSGPPWVGLLGSTRQLLGLASSADLYWLPTTVLDLTLAVLVPVTLFLQRRSIRSTDLVFAWAILSLSLMKLAPGDTLVSFSRYMIAVFPFFVAIAPRLQRPGWRRVILGVCLVLQGLLLSMFYIWSWAG